MATTVNPLVPVSQAPTASNAPSLVASASQASILASNNGGKASNFEDPDIDMGEESDPDDPDDMDAEGDDAELRQTKEMRRQTKKENRAKFLLDPLGAEASMDHILKYDASKPYDILQLPEGQAHTQQDIKHRFALLIELIHPKRNPSKEEKANKALRRLVHAAGSIIEDHTVLEEGGAWRPSAGHIQVGVDAEVSESKINPPPERVRRIYNEMTPQIHQLLATKNNEELEKYLNGMNQMIKNGNEATDGDSWTIKTKWFSQQLLDLTDRYMVLRKDPEIKANDTKKALREIKALEINVAEMFARNHLPVEWYKAGVDELLKVAMPNKVNGVVAHRPTLEKAIEAVQNTLNTRILDTKNESSVRGLLTEVVSAHEAVVTLENSQQALMSADAVASTQKLVDHQDLIASAAEAYSKLEPILHESPPTGLNEVNTDSTNSAFTGSFDYPWAVRVVEPGKIRILGWRKVGTGAHVLMERKENGKWVRRLEKMGKTDAELIKTTTWNISEDQRQLRKKDGETIKTTHFITASRAQARPVAYALVEVYIKDEKTGKIDTTSTTYELITVSNLRNALGQEAGNAKIAELCERDGILTPGEAKALHSKALDSPEDAKAAASKSSKKQSSNVTSEASNTSESEASFNSRPSESEPSFNSRLSEMEASFNSRLSDMEASFNSRLQTVEEGNVKQQQENSTKMDKMMSMLEMLVGKSGAQPHREGSLFVSSDNHA